MPYLSLKGLGAQRLAQRAQQLPSRAHDWSAFHAWEAVHVCQDQARRLLPLNTWQHPVMLGAELVLSCLTG